MVEDDWGAVKTVKTGEKPERSMGAEESQHCGEDHEGATQGNHPKVGPVDQPESGSAQPTSELEVEKTSQPPPPLQSQLVVDGLETGNSNQLLSPRCRSQTTIVEFFQQKYFDDNAELRGGQVTVVEGAAGDKLRTTEVFVPPSELSVPPVGDENVQTTTPSVRPKTNQECLEEVRVNDDVMASSMNTDMNECEINKRKLWCKMHECDVRCSNVTSKSWQYNKKKMQYMWMSRNVKKYVCTAKCERRVQLMPTSVTDDGGQTTPNTSNMGQYEGFVIDDYSGATQEGSGRITSAGL